MILQVRLFAAAKEAVGQELVPVEVSDEGTVAHVRQVLIESWPSAAEIFRHSMFSVDSDYAVDSQGLHEGADIACIPPVSGG